MSGTQKPPSWGRRFTYLIITLAGIMAPLLLVTYYAQQVAPADAPNWFDQAWYKENWYYLIFTLAVFIGIPLIALLVWQRRNTNQQQKQQTTTTRREVEEEKEQSKSESNYRSLLWGWYDDWKNKKPRGKTIKILVGLGLALASGGPMTLLLSGNMIRDTLEWNNVIPSGAECQYNDCVQQGDLGEIKLVNAPVSSINRDGYCVMDTEWGAKILTHQEHTGKLKPPTCEHSIGEIIQIRLATKAPNAEELCADLPDSACKPFLTKK